MKPHNALILAAAGLLLTVQAAAAQGAPPVAEQDAPPGSPPKDAAPTPPKTNIDPKMAVPPVQAPPSSTNTPKAQGDSVKGKDDSVKKVAPAPSDPDKPGVRPL